MYRTLLAATALVLLASTPATAQATITGRYRMVPLDSPPVLRHFVRVVDLHHEGALTGDLLGTAADYWNEFDVPDGAWVYAIEVGERDTGSCTLALRWATIENGALQTGTKVHSNCGNVRTRTGTAGFNVRDPVGEFPRYADQLLGVVTGFQVCQQSSDGQIKGLTVEGQSIDDLFGPFAGVGGNPMTGSGFLASFEMSRCQPAQNRPAMCPPGHVLIGLRAAIREALPYHVFTGLAPACARLRVVN